MARIRSIHPGLFTDEAFMTLTVECPLAVPLLLGLWTEADDEGVFEWKPLTIKARILPAAACSVDDLLACLVRNQFLIEYDVGGKKYGAVRNFCKFQRPKKPNPIHPKTPTAAAWVGASSEPVGNQFGTGGENPPQMEDGGWRREKEEEASASSAREPEKMIGDFPEAVVKRHRLALVAAFGGGASAPVDIGLFTTWVAAYGWDPEVIAATIMGHLGDAAKRAKGMKYWEKVVREVFDKRASAPAPVPKGPPPKPADPHEISAGRWLELLEMRRINGTWAAARYGPPPGDPGCLVPAEVLSLYAERNRAA